MHRLLALVLAALLPTVALGHDVRSINYSERDGLAEVAAQGADIDTVFAIASVGKTFTSVAILQLAERGILTLEDPAANWLSPEIVRGFGGLGGIKIHHLLTMTSGLPDYYSNDYLKDALADPDHVQNPTTALGYAFDERRLSAPGRAFDYSNTNYVLLGLILEQATGETYAQVLQDQVFDPAGMTDTFVFGTRPLPATFAIGHEGGQHIQSYYQGQGFGDGGALSTARDLARFYRALLTTSTLLDEPSLSRMLFDPRNDQYGMGIEVEGTIVGHSGGDLGFSSDVRFDRATGALALTLIGSGDADTGWAMDTILGP